MYKKCSQLDSRLIFPARESFIKIFDKWYAEDANRRAVKLVDGETFRQRSGKGTTL